MNSETLDLALGLDKQTGKMAVPAAPRSLPHERNRAGPPPVTSSQRQFGKTRA